MRKFFKALLVAVLRFESGLILKKYKPEIIAVTGSVGKTSAKEAIWAVLSAKFNIRKSEKSHNSELGTPLTIIGEENPWHSAIGWAKVVWRGAGIIFKGYFKRFARGKNKGETRTGGYPEKLILEVGADRPGDIEKLVGWIKPKIGVITAIGEIPAHVEFFAGTEDLAREKAKLVEVLSSDGWAVLNTDDDVVLDMKEKTRAKVLTYGFDERADIKASEYKLMLKDDRPEGITFKMDYDGSSVPVRVSGVFGRQAVYATLAGAATGVIYKMNLVEISEALNKYKGVAGRLRLIAGEKDTLILDDTYNASPQSMHAAIDLLSELPAKRKIAVLGDMLEIGKYTIQAHQEVGRKLKDVADIVITAGPRAKFIADELLAKRFSSKKIFNFSDSRETGQELERIIEPGDLILVKGSQAMRMERVAEEVMAEPDKKSELLVRQEPEWLNKR